MLINDLLKLAIEKRASDLHLKVGSHPVLRVNGELTAVVDHRRLQTEDTLNMAFSVMNNRQKQKFKDSFDVDVAYSVPGLGRFRCNVFQQRGIFLEGTDHRLFRTNSTPPTRFASFCFAAQRAVWLRPQSGAKLS